MAPLQEDEQPTSSLKPLRRETQPHGPAGKSGVWMGEAEPLPKVMGLGGVFRDWTIPAA